MAANIAAFRTKIAGSAGITGRLQDAAARLGVVAGGPLDECITNAVEEYSKLRPLNAAIKLTGAGSTDFAISSLTGFVDQFSTVLEVLCPYDSTLVAQDPLPADAWFLERLDTGLYLRLLYTVSGGQYVLVRYTKPHAVDASGSTIPATDDEAVADLATHYACLALADYYSQSTDASLSADVDDRRGKADLYRSNAERWRQSWRRKMGLDPAELYRKASPQSVCVERA